MPELIAGGPIIPVPLLNELDSGKVVFFCGAGISEGLSSGLPNFAGLVQHVYEANHIKPDAVESEALDLEEPATHRRRPALDKALGLLERPERLGAIALRRTVIKRLSEPPSGDLLIHKALIELSRNERGVRLITTNFDNRFVEAGLDKELVDAAPKVPVPKPHNWSSLVHLHGRIAPKEDGSNLVLTAADFGRAYLTERWAARFVTELFREFIVVFVGYSVSDPVMSYMVDALAAERDKGAQFTPAYAFAEEDGSDAGRSKARDGWRAKNVEPILYNRRDGHRLLAETLIEWAQIRKDPFHARSRIAINEMSKIPAGPDDQAVERVVWALQDPVAATTLADEPPVMDDGEYAKLEAWLDMFAEKKLLCCTAEDIKSNGSDQNPAVVPLVDNGYRSENPNNLDMTRARLSFWLARHLHVPQLLAWVLRNGGHLHPRLRQEVQRNLVKEESNIPARLRLLWTVLLNNKPIDPWKGLWTSSRYAAAVSESERHRIEDDVIESIAPRLIVQPGPAPGLAFKQYVENKPTPILPIDTCGHLKLVSGDDDLRHEVREVLNDPEVLARHADTLTGHLEQALDLGEEDDEVYPDSYWYRPSISAHEQNRDYDEWTHLIDLVRDSHLALAAVNRRRAENLLLRWMESRQSLFRRLTLHALTENPKFYIRLARKLLLAGRKPGLWELEMRREVMRFLRLAGERLPRDLRTEIVRAIHTGPKSKKGKALPNYEDIIRREKALRLYKLSVSGARLNKKSRALAEEAILDGDPDDFERDEFLSWHGEARWIGDEEFAPVDLVEGSISDVVAALDDEKVGQDELRGLVVRKRVKVATALRRLAKQGKWPPIYWQGFLWHLAGPHEKNAPLVRLHAYVATILVQAPDGLFTDVGTAAADFLSRLAKEYAIDRETEFGLLWTKAWTSKGEVEPQTAEPGNPLTDALNDPAGKLAEAALTRLQKYEPQAGEGIPEVVRPYFDSIGQDPDGHLGRVMLASRLYYLFAVDPDWTTEHMIVRLSPGQSQEAANLWSAYGWSPRLGPDLLRAFKDPFLEILQDEGVDDRKLGNLRGLFVTVCLEAPEELSDQEIRSVVEPLPEEGLKTLLVNLEQRLRGEAEERGRIWRNKVHPWLSEYWPQAEGRNTVGTSEVFLKMLVECGDAFPQAVKGSLEYLRPLEGRSLYRFDKNGHATHHPNSMLQVLNQIVDADVLPTHQRHPLREALDELRTANTEVASDSRFQRLYQIANQ